MFRVWFVSLTVLILACSKDDFLDPALVKLRLSSDTLRFDTVFVTTGSTYRSFTLSNDFNKKMLLSSIRLGGGTNSPFKLNLNGQAGHRFDQVIIEAKDSLYGWIQVNIDPANNNLPFVVRDSVILEINGKSQTIQLEAWGRNAQFLRNARISQSQTWTREKPYVILGGLTIDANTTLTLEAGTRVYMHADAPLLVKGTLRCVGEADSVRRVYFQGDRLDEPYRDLPAAWPGIFFQPGSSNNLLRYTNVEQAYQAIVVEQGANASDPVLKLEQCQIDNAFDAGLIGINSYIIAENCLISNCGQNTVLIGGGRYQFIHCTLASYSNRYLDHTKPVLTVTNFYENTARAIQAQFTNCIFWGEGGLVEDEVLLAKNATAPYQVHFQNALWKMRSAVTLATSDRVINNQSPLFDSIPRNGTQYNFRLKAGSPALQGGTSTSLPVDLDGRPRAVGLPDLGCYEKQ